MTAPLAQSLRALDRANEIRCGKARVKREIAAGRLTVLDALKLEECERATVWELVISQRSWGRARTLQLLRNELRWRGLPVRLSAVRMVEELTDRELAALTDALGAKA